MTIKPFFILLLLCSISIFGQDKLKGFYKVGFHYGTGNIDNFLFNDEDYFYEVDFFKLPMYYRLKSGKFDFELFIQPEYNQARHELLNFYFVDTDAERERFMQRRVIKEYILSFGFLVRKDIFKWMSGHALVSIGAGHFDRGSERLSKGFAFSDVLAIGLTFKPKEDLHIEIQPSFRHVSNANLNPPNSGYNSLNIEFGISYVFGK